MTRRFVIRGLIIITVMGPVCIQMDIESKKTLDAVIAESKIALLDVEGKLSTDLKGMIDHLLSGLNGWEVEITLQSPIKIKLKGPKS